MVTSRRKVMHSTSLPCASKTGLASRISFRPSETVCTRVAGCPVRHDLRVQHHVEPAALDELHHGMPQHLFAGDARDFGMAPVQMHDGPFHVGDADPLFEGVKKLIKILLQHYMSVLSL